ncbi:hypothetical protein [Parashewanella tropica]|uniref:hypothetical protein n=1 Tax=Parashewanella tropica TaxID=2547970 RepID=UPI0010599BB3|nr:hypothetical protein [Parashewanella tropica]
MAVSLASSVRQVEILSPIEEEPAEPSYASKLAEETADLKEYETTNFVGNPQVTMEFMLKSHQSKVSASVSSVQEFKNVFGTREALLNKLTKANGINFSALPLVTEKRVLPLSLDQVLATCFVGNETSGLLTSPVSTVPNFAYHSHQLLYSTGSAQCFLNNFRLPNNLSIVQGAAKANCRVEMRAETVMVDVLLLAIRRNRPVIFINPKLMSRRNCVIQYPDLHCDFIGLIEIVDLIEMGTIKQPFFVTCDENNIYLFQTKPTAIFQQIEMIELLMEQFIVTAFSDSFWQDSSRLETILSIQATQTNESCLRLIPTVQGLAVKEFTVNGNDFLLDQSNYVCFLLEISEALICQYPERRMSKELTMHTVLAGVESEHYFSNTSSILIKAGFEPWLESVRLLKAYAGGGNNEATDMKARLCYKEVVEQFEAQYDGEVKNAMLMKLAEIDHTERIARLEKKDQCIKNWLAELSVIPELQREEARGDSGITQLPNEVIASFRRGMRVLEDFAKGNLEARSEKVIDTCIYQLIQYFKPASGSEIQDYAGRRQYLEPIRRLLKEQLVTMEQSEVGNSQLCDAFVSALVDQEVANPMKIDAPDVSHRYRMFLWLKETKYWASLTKKQQVMLLNNGFIVYDMLLGKKEQLEDKFQRKKMDIIARAYRATDCTLPEELYGASDIDDFMLIVQDLYELCHHRTLIPTSCKRFIERCIPAVRCQLLRRCWPDQESMHQSFNRAFSELKTKMLEKDTTPAPSEGRAVALTHSELQVVQSELKMALMNDGMQLQYQNLYVKLKVPLLANAAKDNTSARQAMISAFSPNQNPLQFDMVWGGYSTRVKLHG